MSRPTTGAQQSPGHVVKRKLDQIPIVKPDTTGKGEFFSKDSFKEVGASKEMIDALAKMGITRPAKIQVGAFSYSSRFCCLSWPYFAIYFSSENVSRMLLRYGEGRSNMMLMLDFVSVRRCGNPGKVPPCTVQRSLLLMI